MATPGSGRKQSMSNMLLLMLLFYLPLLFWMRSQQQQQPPVKRSGEKPPPFPTDIAKVLDIESLSHDAAKKEAMKLIAQAKEFDTEHDFAAYALLRSGTIIAEKFGLTPAEERELEALDTQRDLSEAEKQRRDQLRQLAREAAEAYNEAFGAKTEGDRIPKMNPRSAGSQIINLVVKNHSKSTFYPQALLQQAQVLTVEGRTNLDKEAVGAWETARNTNKRLNEESVVLRDDGGFRRSTIDEEACVHLDGHYRTGYLYRFMDWLTLVFGNKNRQWSYGLALIFYGVFFKLLLYPLNRMQIKSFKAMADMSPQIKEIQEKYKDSKDPAKLQKMNAEMGSVYKKAGTNPMLGCVVAIAQLPFFYLMYQTVSHYQCQFRASSFLWIHSLAKPDNVLLGLYVCTMILQSLTMPKQRSADPQQEATQKMMTWIMPIMFAGMMYNWQFPSAFVVYWLTGNIFAIAQQWKAMHEDGKFNFKEEGVKGVIKRLISPLPASSPTNGKPPTNGKSDGEGSAASNGSGDIKPRPRRKKKNR